MVSYGARCAALADTLHRSHNYEVELYIADKQRNPLNAKIAKVHQVIPDLNVQQICDLAVKHQQSIDFGIVGAEGPIIDGVRDLIEREAGIPFICPTKDSAIERSKVEQRLLLSETVPEVNPRFQIFDPKQYPPPNKASEAAKKWIAELGGVTRVVIKPDKPGYGKGVGVGGEHFLTTEEAMAHLLSLFGGPTGQKVIIEEKVEGEESSFQTWCDGKSLVAMPETRDYKRAFDGDKGPNTGGMGSYRSEEDYLPFMTQSDRETEIEIATKIFHRLRESGEGSSLRGTPFYIAFIHTAGTPKILEINSRPGDPEIMAVLPTLEDDFVDICFGMVNGTLKKPSFRREAAVLTYAVPLTYGGYREHYTGSSVVNLEQVYKLAEAHESRLRVYPGSIELKDNLTYTLKSRTVGVLGIGKSIEEARDTSLKGVRHIDGPLWNRWDIASERHIAYCKEHMKRLR